MNDESTDEVEVGLQFMLFRELPTQTGHSKSVISRIRKTQISLNCGNFVFSRKLSKSKEATYLFNLRGANAEVSLGSDLKIESEMISHFEYEKF